MTPANSISTRNKGIQMYVARAGIVKVVITRITHIAATNARATIIGTIASIIASNGLPKLFYFNPFLISYDDMLMPPAENMTRKITAAINKTQKMQQKKSVQCLSGMGPFRH